MPYKTRNHKKSVTHPGIVIPHDRITFSQLTGTKTIPGTYATVAAAITDLNTQGVGAGANPVLTGFATAPGTTDYIICFQGTDYITFDGIDLSDPAGVIEWGFAVLKASATDGSQFVTLKK